MSNPIKREESVNRGGNDLLLTSTGSLHPVWATHPFYATHSSCSLSSAVVETEEEAETSTSILTMKH